VQFTDFATILAREVRELRQISAWRTYLRSVSQFIPAGPRSPSLPPTPSRSRRGVRGPAAALSLRVVVVLDRRRANLPSDQKRALRSEEGVHETRDGSVVVAGVSERLDKADELRSLGHVHRLIEHLFALRGRRDKKTLQEGLHLGRRV
jgi:hypothetical protein